jgi:agmatinase
MFNIMKIPAVGKLVQVGIRDSTQEETDALERGRGRIQTYFDDALKARLSRGTSWNSICEEIVSQLPPLVYLSLDINGLDTSPQTLYVRTHSGGLRIEQLSALIKCIALSGRKIIGFDVAEIPARDHDQGIIAEILYQLCCWMAVSHKLLATDR